MKQGFTVKAKTAPKKEKGPEWDFDAIKEYEGQGNCILSTWAWMFICLYEELCTVMF